MYTLPNCLLKMTCVTSGNVNVLNKSVDNLRSIKSFVLYYDRITLFLSRSIIRVGVSRYHESLPKFTFFSIKAEEVSPSQLYINFKTLN